MHSTRKQNLREKTHGKHTLEVGSDKGFDKRTVGIGCTTAAENAGFVDRPCEHFDADVGADKQWCVRTRRGTH
jgi:hypothetical protein